MKKTLHWFLITFMAFSVTFTSCKKSDTTPTDNTSEFTTHSDDQSRFSGDMDEISNDANYAIEDFNAFEGKEENTSRLICGTTTVMDSSNGLRRITITYNGLNCMGNRYRTGVVVLTMPLGQRWRDQGATLTVNVQNLRITRVRDNKSITINGTHVNTNVTGGRLRDLATLGTIIHTVSTPAPGMSVTFDNNTTRTWMVAKKRTFTFNNGMNIKVEGTHTDGSTTGIAMWGTNRFGNTFVTVISQPLIVREDCNFRLVSGEVSHQRMAVNVTVTFGLDVAGNPTTCPGLASYYMKLVWIGAGGVVRTVIIPY